MFDKMKFNFGKFRISSIIILSLCLLMINSLTLIMKYSVVIRVVYIVGIVAYTLFVSKSLSFKTIEQKIWFSFLLYITASSIVMGNKDAMDMLFSMWCFSLILIINLDVDFYKRLIKAFNVFIFVFVLSMYINLVIPSLMTGPLNFFLLDPIKGNIAKETAAGVYSGLFAEKLAAAYGSCIGFVFSYSQYLRKLKIKYLILPLFYIAGIFLTGKRIATIIPIVIILVTLIINLRNKKIFKKVGKYLLALFILLIIGAILVPQIRSVFDKVFAVVFSNSNTTEDLTSNRESLLWPLSLSMFVLNPIFGHGFCTYNSYVSFLYRASDSILSSWSTNGHNIYLQLLGETGIVGSLIIFSLFLCLLIGTIRLYKKIKDTDDKQLCVISLGIQIVFLLVGITENVFYVTAQLLTYIVALGIFIALQKKYSSNRLAKKGEINQTVLNDI